jgi:predicted alpha/beta hydrolase
MESRRVEQEPIDLYAADGQRLGATWFHPLVTEPRAAVIINGATAVPASYYARFAEHLAARSLSVLTYDYRGVGASRSRGLDGFHASMTDWAHYDARAALDHVQERLPGTPMVLVGHSFGGQLIGLLEEANHAALAVLVGAQLGYYGHWPQPERARLALMLNFVLPLMTRTFGYLPGWTGIGEDLPRGVAEEWARWCTDPDYFMGTYPDARDRFARFGRPTLFYSFTDDDFAPQPATARLVELLGSAELVHRRVRPRELGAASVGHFGFFRPRFAATLWRETIRFIDDGLAGRRFTPDRTATACISEEEIMAELAYGR